MKKIYPLLVVLLFLTEGALFAEPNGNSGKQRFTVVPENNEGRKDQTDCNSVSVPYSENFNSIPAVDWNVSGGYLPDCWDGYSNGGNAYFPHVTSSSSSFHYSPDGSNSITMTVGYQNSYGNKKIVILPEFDLPIEQLSISFDYQMEDALEGSLSIGTVRGSDLSTFYEVVELESSETMTSVTVDFSSEDVDWLASRIAIMWCIFTALDEDWNYWSVGIDNVEVFETSPHITDCDPLPVPFFEDFNSTMAVHYNDEYGRLPDCWDGYSNGTDDIYLPHVTNYSNSNYYSPDGSNSITLFSGCGDWLGNTKILVLPDFTAAIKDLEVSFSYQMESQSDGTFSIGYVTGNDFQSTFHAVQTIPNSESMTQVTVSMANAPITAKRIAFRWFYNGYSEWLPASMGIDNVHVTHAATDAIADVMDVIDCKVYPNPTTKSATLEIGGVSGAVKVFIVDTDGREVLEKDYVCGGGCVLNIEVASLPHGIYFVHIITSSGTAVKKLVVE